MIATTLPLASALAMVAERPYHTLYRQPRPDQMGLLTFER